MRRFDGLGRWRGATRRALATWGLVGVAGVVGGAAASCRQIAGVHPRESVQAECAACEQSSCSGEESACRANGACAGRLDCQRACDGDDAACRASCATRAAGEVIGRLEACGAATCAGSCASACGGVLPVVPAASAVDCTTCVAQACCAEAAACGDDAECRVGLECVRASSTPDVVSTCTDVRHAGGAATFHAFDSCVKSSCPEPCAYGADWSCVGSVVLPAPSSDVLDDTLTLVDASDQSKPVAGLVVQACFIVDAECAAPSITTTSDASGTARLPLSALAQSGRPGFLGYLTVTDPRPTPLYVPTLAFPGVAITQTGYAQRIIATSFTELQQLAAVLGEAIDPTRGFAVLSAVDCAGHTSEGMTFTLDRADSQTLLVYPTNGVPSRVARATDANGTAIVEGIPPGPVVVTARVAATGQVTSQTSFLVRANAVSIVLVPPTP